MISQLTKADLPEVSRLVLIILKDMELDFLNVLPEAEVLSLIEEACLDHTYRYGLARGIAVRKEGQVAGVAFGYLDTDEPIIDLPFTKVLEKHHLDPTQKLFVDKETLPGEWYLDSLVVNDKFRGHGIGSELLDALPAIARKSGVHKVGLNVDVSNPKAEALYTRKGFKPVDTCILSGHHYTHMQKNID